MAKTFVETPLTTRTARSNLPPGLYWRGIDAQVHLGYRRGKRGGEWLVRWRSGAGYKRSNVVLADDSPTAGTLDYNAAVRAARKIAERAQLEAKALVDGPPLTVRSAMEEYIATFDARESKRAGRPIRSHTSRRLHRYLLGQPKRGSQPEVGAAPLASIKLAMLNERYLIKWRDGLPGTIKATTRQRLINDVRAALNAAFNANRERLPPTLDGTIRHGLRRTRHEEDAELPGRDNQILDDGQIANILKAAREIDAERGWEGDLFRIVLTLAATGARFAQLARMRVGDCQIKESRLLVPANRKVRGVKAGSTPIPVGGDVLDALAPIVNGRPADAPLFERWRHEQVSGEVRWQRAERGPWQSSAELVRPWHEIRERAGMPAVIPCSLRHSSIVRGIRANLPIRLVAALHDTSTAMIERHYSKWIATGLENMARAAIVPLVPN